MEWVEQAFKTIPEHKFEERIIFEISEGVQE